MTQVSAQKQGANLGHLREPGPPTDAGSCSRQAFLTPLHSEKDNKEFRAFIPKS